MESAVMASATTEGGGSAVAQKQITFNQIITYIWTDATLNNLQEHRSATRCHC